MTLATKISKSLTSLHGYSSAQPTCAIWTAENDTRVEADFTAVDRMSCSIRELRLNADCLQNVSFDVVQEWADEICRRITYLLENMGPLEKDEKQEKVLVRSTPPGNQDGSTVFYEAIFHAPTGVILRRYRSEQGQSGREQIDMHCTNETLQKLVEDLVDSVPGAA
jgi:hypothetical protein